MQDAFCALCWAQTEDLHENAKPPVARRRGGRQAIDARDRIMSTDTDEAVRHGTANLFADLAYADADAHLLKAQLVRRIQQRIAARELTQVQAAKLMGVSQPDVSRMLRGHFRDFSAERLMRFLTALGCAVDIVVRAPGELAARTDTIHLQPAQP